MKNDPEFSYDETVQDDEDSEELDDIMIKADDAVIVCTTKEDEMRHLVVYIVEDPDGDLNMYVHHDMIIPSLPLCTA
ncbi:transducin/WD40 repeat-like superfamily protein [Artemisia annua]|uniref:Transducin/WD40 repeat-like superfamily protein n=1 Tax=Artemisia annua TaxID=35608 RepID=A0A2U1M8D2_ARTAN|nr:transducin/WD40 repeat-like superfamily protein [Artemisia annua]